MSILFFAGLVVLLLGLFAAGKIPTKLGSAIARPLLVLVGAMMIVAGGFKLVFFYAEPGYVYHVRTILGQEKVISDVGYNSHLFGRYNAWKRAMTVQAASDKIQVDQLEAELDSATGSSAELPSLRITFLDQVDAQAFATVRFVVPTDPESFLKMAHEYRTPSNLIRTALIPAFKETLNASAQLMGAEEFYSGGRTQFNAEFEKQMTDGIYVVRREEVRVRTSNRASGSANIALGKDQQAFGDDEQVVFKVRRITDANGQPLRKVQKFTNYGIQVVDARVTDMRPNKAFLQRMGLKQKASADRAIAREQRIQEEEQRLLAIAKGEREVAERQAAAKVEQIQRTTDAETDKQLALTEARKRKEQAEIDRETAGIRLEQARIDAQARQVAADAAAYEKKAILQADNALQQKLDAYVKAQGYWANAFSKRRVPTQVFGATGGGAGTDGDVQAFMNIMTMKAAKDLSVDPGIAAQRPTTQ